MNPKVTSFQHLIQHKLTIHLIRRNNKPRDRHAKPCPFRMQVLNPFFRNHSETWMTASFSRTFAFSSIWHCIIHYRSKSLLIPTSAGGNFWMPSKRTPTKHCFWAIRYSSFQSVSFKEEGISESEPMQNLKKSKNIFCCFNI